MGDATTTPRRLTIVVGHDFSDPANLALAEAITLAENAPGATIHALCVLGHGGYRLGERPLHHYSFAEAEGAQARLERLVARTLERRGSTDVAIRCHCRIGQPAEVIVALGEEVRADLVIVGTHGRSGVERLLLGSVAEAVTRRAGCPVLVMRPTDYRRVERETGPGARAAADDATPRLDEDGTPLPDPPCPACTARRLATAGAEPWCEAHAGTWGGPHRYGYDDGVARTRPDEWALW